jgi:hypothetical protein
MLYSLIKSDVLYYDNIEYGIQYKIDVLYGNDFFENIVNCVFFKKTSSKILLEFIQKELLDIHKKKHNLSDILLEATHKIPGFFHTFVFCF